MDSIGQNKIGITSASIGKPDAKFYEKLRIVFQEISDALKTDVSEAQKQYYIKEIDAIKSMLSNPNPKIKLRNLQKKAIYGIIDMLKKGDNEGYIKLPTGVGKTILFAVIIEALQQATLILEPTKELVDQTKNVFDNETLYGYDEIKVINPEIGETATGCAEKILKEIENKEWNGIIISTNDSIKSIYRNRPDLIERLRKKIDVFVTDEAHKSLGEVHIDMMQNGLQKEINKLHILFTASPVLGKKKVGDYYSCITEASLQDAVDDEILVIPEFAGTGDALLNLEPQESDTSITQEFLNAKCLKFLDEDGNPIYEGLTNKYLEVKRQSPNGYAPALAVCADIAQAEFIERHLKSKGLRVVRVTSEKTGYDKPVSPNEAKKMLQTDKVDVIITVSMVTEGWDVPTLRNIIKYYPNFSEAKIIQAFGRIIRTVEYKHIEEMISMMEAEGIHIEKSDRELLGFLLKTRENTHLIEPIRWQIKNPKTNTGKHRNNGNRNDSGSQKKYIPQLTTIPNTIQTLYNSNELNKEQLSEFFPKIELQEISPEIEEDGTVKINEKIYQQIGQNTPIEQLRGLTPGIVYNKTKEQSEERQNMYLTFAKSKGHTTQVVEKEKLKEILQNRIGLPQLKIDGTVEIENKIYQWVGTKTPSEQLEGLSGWIVNNRIKKQSQEWQNKYVKIAIFNAQEVQVVEKEALKEIIKNDSEVPVVNPDGTVEIENKIYQWVGYETSSEQLRGVSGVAAKNKIKKQSQEWQDKYVKSAKLNSQEVQIVERVVLKKLLQNEIGLPELKIDGTVEIGEGIYKRVGVHTSKEQLRGVSGATATKKVKQQSEEWKNIYVKVAKTNGGKVQVIERENLKEILKDEIGIHELTIDGTVKIEDKIYQRVGYETPSSQLGGKSGKIVGKRIKEQSQERKNQYIKIARFNSQKIQVVEQDVLQEILFLLKRKK